MSGFESLQQNISFKDRLGRMSEKDSFQLEAEIGACSLFGRSKRTIFRGDTQNFFPCFGAKPCALCKIATRASAVTSRTVMVKSCCLMCETTIKLVMDSTLPFKVSGNL